MNKQPKLKLSQNKFGVITRIDLEVPILTRELNGKFLVKCPLFNAVGYSEKSYEDAYDDYAKGIELFFKLHLHKGSLRTALASLGWVRGLDKNKYAPPADKLKSISDAPLRKESVKLAA